jgi:vacuolar-type H+-ATPase subunit H
LHKQKTILQEGELLNKKLNQEILDDAQRKAEEIIKQAATETKRAQEELASNRELAVKTTTKAVVKKLLKDDKHLQDDYLKTLVDDLKD